jgi:hypothetical protein
LAPRAPPSLLFGAPRPAPPPGGAPFWRPAPRSPRRPCQPWWYRRSEANSVRDAGQGPTASPLRRAESASPTSLSSDRRAARAGHARSSLRCVVRPRPPWRLKSTEPRKQSIRRQVSGRSESAVKTERPAARDAVCEEEFHYTAGTEPPNLTNPPVGAVASSASSPRSHGHGTDPNL